MKTFIVEADFTETVTGRVFMKIRADNVDDARKFVEAGDYDDIWMRNSVSQGHEIIWDDSVKVLEQ
jgi:hypothetical protein